MAVVLSALTIFFSEVLNVETRGSIKKESLKAKARVSTMVRLSIRERESELESERESETHSRL